MDQPTSKEGLLFLKYKIWFSYSNLKYRSIEMDSRDKKYNTVCMVNLTINGKIFEH